jgi:hypothetical protein
MAIGGLNWCRICLVGRQAREVHESRAAGIGSLVGIGLASSEVIAFVARRPIAGVLGQGEIQGVRLI